MKKIKLTKSSLEREQKKVRGYHLKQENRYPLVKIPVSRFIE